MLTVALLSVSLTGCEKSCREEAVDEMSEIQKEAAANGGENSINGYYNEQQAYADSKCGAEE